MKSSAQCENQDQGQTILLVEDEGPVRTVVKRVLQRHGYHVLEATCSQEALDLWQQHADRIVLLFTDLVLPDGMNGRELAQRLRSQKHTLRILFTTGYNSDVVAPLAGDVGVHFLAKPYRPAELVQMVQQSIHGIS